MTREQLHWMIGLCVCLTCALYGTEAQACVCTESSPDELYAQATQIAIVVPGETQWLSEEEHHDDGSVTWTMSGWERHFEVLVALKGSPQDFDVLNEDGSMTSCDVYLEKGEPSLVIFNDDQPALFQCSGTAMLSRRSELLEALLQIAGGDDVTLSAETLIATLEAVELDAPSKAGEALEVAYAPLDGESLESSGVTYRFVEATEDGVHIETLGREGLYVVTARRAMGEEAAWRAILLDDEDGERVLAFERLE